MTEHGPIPKAALLDWWAKDARDIPWRATRDPWLVLVSEVMSQQTQVSRVIPKWTAFIERFPTPGHAGAVSAGELISMWVGLGYNRRALLLHKCALQIEERHGGVVPNDLDALLELSGIGPYTARAVLAFAFEVDVGVLDTNVGRVLARLTGRSLATAEAQRLADSLVPEGQSWEWNQAILDFGAGICQKRTPQCEACPLSGNCVWRGSGVDPAVGSAAVSVRQSAFEGSDRQGRAQLVSRLSVSSLAVPEALETLGFGADVDRAERVLNTLVEDGLVVRQDTIVRLP